MRQRGVVEPVSPEAPIWHEAIHEPGKAFSVAPFEEMGHLVAVCPKEIDLSTINLLNRDLLRRTNGHAQ